MEKLKTFLLNNKWASHVMMLLIGAVIGGVFYPTKHVEETLTKRHEAEIATLNQTHATEVASTKAQYDKQLSDVKKTKIQSDKKVSILTTQVRNLQTKQKTTYYKLVHPDGTVEIKESSEKDSSESDKVTAQIQQEYKTKIDEVETKWETIHKQMVTQLQKEYDTKSQTYQKTIDDLKQTKVVDTNAKSFGVEAGMLTNRDYYGHITYDVIGPIFLGLHAEGGTNNALGIGAGLRF